MTNTTKITVETTVAAPIEHVWRAYTTPDDIKQWNAASDDWHTTSATVDLRVGGAFSSRMEAKDGTMGFDFAGTYTKIVEHELIEYSFGDRAAQVAFATSSKGVKLRVTFDSEQTHSVEQQRQGWQAILNNFAKHVEAGRRAAQAATSADEKEISTLIEQWSKAVRDQSVEGIRADHDPDILMFDVPPPFLSQGLDAYMATWDTFFASSEKPVMFNFHDVRITASADVAFATAIGKCVNIDHSGRREPLEFRLTMGLRKVSGRWRVTHEHHSLPAI